MEGLMIVFFVGLAVFWFTFMIYQIVEYNRSKREIDDAHIREKFTFNTDWKELSIVEVK